MSTTELQTAGGTRHLVRHWDCEGEAWASLLIVHGIGEHSGRYERTGGLLAGEGIDTWSFDLSGSGGSDGRRGYVESWSQYLDEVAEHLAPRLAAGRPAVLLGHSMGGLIALGYCLSDRPAPALLVLSAPALHGGAGWQRAAAGLIAKIAPKLALPTQIKGEQLSRDPSVGEAYFSDSLVFTKATTRLAAELFGAMAQANAALDRLKVETLVIHGGQDTVVPPPASLPLTGRIGIERTLYPALRHELFNEPEGPEVVADVVAWIRGKVGG